MTLGLTHACACSFLCWRGGLSHLLTHKSCVSFITYKGAFSAFHVSTPSFIGGLKKIRQAQALWGLHTAVTKALCHFWSGTLEWGLQPRQALGEREGHERRGDSRGLVGRPRGRASAERDPTWRDRGSVMLIERMCVKTPQRSLS